MTQAICSGARANFDLANPRILLGCLHRCFCTWGLQDTSVEPKRLPLEHIDGVESTRQTRSSESYELQIDAPDDWYQGQYHFEVAPRDPNHYKRGRHGAQAVDTVFVTTMPEASYRRSVIVHGGWIGRQTWPVGMHEDNKIECRGDLPPWPYPGGYTSSDFTDLASLCAVQWSGGSK